MLLRYSQLCAIAFDTVGAVKLEIPKGFEFVKFKTLSLGADGSDSPATLHILAHLLEHRLMLG